MTYAGAAVVGPRATLWVGFLRRSWGWEVVLLVLAYLLAYGTLLYKTDGIPYVFDNNESFSALVHGSNLYHFDLSRSYGLTDEAYGPDPAAHPYVYTHQGNFPRLFTYLLYAAGARSVEAQIAISTFSIGLGTILLGYLFFSGLAGRLYGTTVAALLLTDYIFSAQWLVNTFKVWHGFLLFWILCALQAYFRDCRGRWLGLVALAAAFVAYFDLLLAVFTFSLAALFILAGRGRAGWRSAVSAGVALAAGAGLSATVFILQLLGYYGIEGLKGDLYLTFMGRNYVSSDPAVNEQWRLFFTEQRIVFWEMLVDSSVYTGPIALVKSVFIFGFSIFTPYFSFLVFALVLGKSLSLAVERMARVPGANGRWLQIGAEFLAWMSANVLLALILFTSNLETAANVSPILGVAYSNVVLLVFAAVAATVFVALGHERNRANAGRLLAVAVYFLSLIALLKLHPRLYHVHYGDAQLIWEYVLKPWRASGSQKLFAVLAAGCGAWWILRAGTAHSTTHELTGVRHAAIFRFGLLLVLAFLAAYYFSPGYMQVINLHRFVPVMVFVLLPVAAWAFCCAFEQARLLQRRGVFEPGALGRAALGALLTLHMVVFWVWLQKSYIEIAPPDGAEVFKMLDKPPFRGASFVVNSYGAPIAVKTQSWAYVDPKFFHNARYVVDELGYRPDGSSLYKWFADRDDPKYRNPEYALCFHMHPGLNYALRALKLWHDAAPYNAELKDIFAPSPGLRRAIEADTKREFGCAIEPLMIRAEAGHLDGLNLAVVARDRSLLDRWSIIKLEHDFPPYLAPLRQDRGNNVEVKIQRSAGRCIATTSYEYRQQQGKLESETTMEVWLDAPRGENKVQQWLYSGTAREALTLPPGAQGTLLISVTPRSATRTGRTYMSPPVELRGC